MPTAPDSRRNARRAILAGLVAVLCLAAPVFGVAAADPPSTAADPPSPPAGFRLAAADGRDVVLLPAGEASARLRSASGAVLGRSWETGKRRIHEVTLEGRTYRAATPLDGPASRIAFDMSRRRFARLLPGIRVGCASREEADSIGKLARATRTRYLDKLGFAILDLPDTVHPAEAAARVNAELGGDKASVRIRRRNPRWK